MVPSTFRSSGSRTSGTRVSSASEPAASSTWRAHSPIDQVRASPRLRISATQASDSRARRMPAATSRT